MKARVPTFGAYAIAYNILKSDYPWKEVIKNALTFCDKFHILECGSDDGTWEAIQDEFKNTPGVVLKRAKESWDFNDVGIVGKMKQRAREMVTEDYCVYLDLDEIFVCKSRNTLLDLVLNHPQGEVFSLPYITFFGSPYKIANFKEAENYWRWKVFKNRPYIGHGAHGKARKYDENGLMTFDKTISDGCEIINLQTLEIMPSIIYAPPMYVRAGEDYRKVPTDEKAKKHIGVIFSETINDFPLCIYHYGWVDFETKEKNGKEYWTKTKAYKTGVEHSRLFDGLADGNSKIDEWKKIDTIDLIVREHPEIMRPRLKLKPKVLSISLSSNGPFGVPKWVNSLKSALPDYDVQILAFEDFITHVPEEATEIDKARSFIQFIKSQNLDKDAVAIFADGFWAATYPGPAPVISVIHGLWSHPMRDKWEDGISKLRQYLSAYQMAYYKTAAKIGHKLVCVSQFIHKILADIGIESTLIPNAVDVAHYDKFVWKGNVIEKSRPLVVHGITSVNKGADIKDKIEKRLDAEGFDFASIDEVAAHIGCPKEVVFKVADIAFLPSKWEASSYLLLECAANNLPIVAHRAGILNCSDLSHIDKIGIIQDDYDIENFVKNVKVCWENNISYKCGRMFVRENKMDITDWKLSINELMKEIKNG